MVEMSEKELLYSPEDLIAEDIELEIAPEAFTGPLHCPHCDAELELTTATKTLGDGKFTVSYEAYSCPKCNRRYFNREQARQFSSILLLEQLLEEKGPELEGSVLFDGHDFFVRLPLAREIALLWHSHFSQAEHSVLDQ